MFNTGSPRGPGLGHEYGVKGHLRKTVELHEDKHPGSLRMKGRVERSCVSKLGMTNRDGTVYTPSTPMKQGPRQLP